MEIRKFRWTMHKPEAEDYRISVFRNHYMTPLLGKRIAGAVGPHTT